MIYDYSIKKENNEEVLYLYLDFNNEFAKLKEKRKKKKISEEITEFIKTNNIKFNGTKIALVAGGLIVGTTFFNTPIKEQNYINPSSNAISILVDNDLKNVEEKIEEESIQQTKKELKKQVTKEVKTTPSNSNVLVENNNESVVEDNKTYVTVYRSNGSTIKLELEEYVTCVVGTEMPAEFNEQAMMAQAVLARTYALKALKNNIRLTDNSSTQNYKSVDELKKMWGSNFDRYYNKVKNAVLSTSGKYLTYNGELIEAVYHSTSNGTTENSINVWGNSFPYLVSVESLYDETNPSFYKETQITYDKLSSVFKTTINNETEFNILSKTSGNRVDKIEIAGTIYTGVQVRTLLGLRSTDFEIVKNEAGVIFQTRGYGHGVGMSQYGANGMAKNGYNYESILKHYYTGVTIQG